MKRWAVRLGALILAGSLTVGAMTLANDPPPEESTTQETTPPEEPQEPVQEKITFEYYTITEEAVKNGWVCQTIGRCDKNRIMVYIHDPAIIGEHKFTLVSGIKLKQLDLVVVYVDEYNNILGEDTFTLTDGGADSMFVKIFVDYPPGTKYVKFKDVINKIELET